MARRIYLSVALAVLAAVAADAEDCAPPGFYQSLPRDQEWYYGVARDANTESARDAAVRNLGKQVTGSVSEWDDAFLTKIAGPGRDRAKVTASLEELVPASTILAGWEQDDSERCDGKSYVLVRVRKEQVRRYLMENKQFRSQLLDSLSRRVARIEGGLADLEERLARLEKGEPSKGAGSSSTGEPEAPPIRADLPQAYASIRRDIAEGKPRAEIERRMSAVELVQKAYDLDERSVKVVEDERGNFIQERRHGRLAQVIELYSQALVLDPSLGEVWQRRGEAYLAFEENDKAVADLEKAVSLGPPALDARKALFRLYMRVKNPANARAHVDAALASDPADPALQEWAEEALMRTGRLESAQAKQSAAEAMGKGDQAQGLIALDAAIKANPKDAQALELRGKLHHRARRYDAALTDLAAAVAASQENTSATAALAMLYATAQDSEVRNPKEAVRLAKKALGQSRVQNYPNPPDYAVVDAFAEANFAAKKFQEAVEAKRKALELAPAKAQEGLRRSLKEFEKASSL